jgi:hypothetical protein
MKCGRVMKMKRENNSLLESRKVMISVKYEIILKKISSSIDVEPNQNCCMSQVEKR